MKRNPLLLPVLAASLSALGCTHYTDWKVAASYELSATRLDPSSGALLSTESLGTVTPPSGSRYVWWSGSTYASSVTGGIAILRIGTCVPDPYRDEEYYDEGNVVAKAVVSSAEGDALVGYTGGSDAVIAGGAAPLLLDGTRGWAVGSGPALVDSGISYEGASSCPFAAWSSGTESGLASTFALGSPHSMSFHRSGVTTFLDGYDSFACAYLPYEGGSNFLAPLFSFALDSSSGKTLKMITLARVDAIQGTASTLWSFSTALSPDALACVDAAPTGVYRVAEGSLVLVGSGGEELGRAALPAADASGRPLAGPLAGSGLVFAAQPMGDERLGSGGGPETAVVSWYDPTPRLSWSVSLPDPRSRVVAVFKYPGYLVAIGARPTRIVAVTHAEDTGF